MNARKLTPLKPTTAAAPRPEPTHDDIALRARAIWEEAGRPQGRALEHWLLAESWLRQRRLANLKLPARILPRPFSRNGSRRGQPDLVSREF